MDWNSYFSFGDGGRQPSHLPKTVHDDATTASSSPPTTSSSAVSGQPHSKDLTPKQRRRPLRQAKAFFQMALPYYRENASARWMFLGLFVLMLLNSAIRVVFSYLARDFWSALANRDVEEFYTIIRNFFLALILLAPVNVFYRFQRQRLAIWWREWFTQRVLDLYYSNRVYYALERNNVASPQTSLEQEHDEEAAAESPPVGVDNPDQRIAEDVKSFTGYSLSFFLTIAVSLIDLCAFSIVLFSIEPVLFVAILAFATIGTMVSIWIGRVLVGLNFERLHLEADFRFSLVRLRENAESIAFFAGERREGQQIQARFDKVIANAKHVIGAQRNLDFCTTLYEYLTWILPILVVAPDFFGGNIEIGVIQQAVAAFSHVLDDMSVIIYQFESLSEFSASIDRLYQFLVAVREADTDRDEVVPLLSSSRDAKREKDDDSDTSKDLDLPASFSFTPGAPLVSPSQFMCRTKLEIHELKPAVHGLHSKIPSAALTVQNLTLHTPDGQRVLLDNLSFRVPWNAHLLIVGPNGVGKSSLLRAIAGLWTNGTGLIRRLHSSEIYFLPQKPYSPVGTLRDQLLYPRSSCKDLDDDEHLLHILDQVDLHGLAERAGGGNPVAGLSAVLDWPNVLSLGEQQRLAFGRVLVHRPRMIICDEATSAMDVAGETKMYTLLRQLGDSVPGGCTFVSVGHRPTLSAHHVLRLDLRGKGQPHSIGPIAPVRQGEISADEVQLFYSGTK